MDRSLILVDKVKLKIRFFDVTPSFHKKSTKYFANKRYSFWHRSIKRYLTHKSASSHQCQQDKDISNCRQLISCVQFFLANSCQQSYKCYSKTELAVCLYVLSIFRINMNYIDVLPSSLEL